MNIILKLSAVLFFTIATSCDSAKSTVQEMETNAKAVKEMDEKLLNDGYSIGIIKYDEKRSNCAYIIIDENSKLQYDPINLEEEKYASFRANDTKIYFKYQALRMMNRCPEAQPILIEEIKKREN